MKKIDSFYDNRVVYKPWGYEYVVYRNSNNLSVTLLSIDYNKKTSGFVCVSWMDFCESCHIPPGFFPQTTELAESDGFVNILCRYIWGWAGVGGDRLGFWGRKHANKFCKKNLLFWWGSRVHFFSMKINILP